jgi:hypothetical protein
MAATSRIFNELRQQQITLTQQWIRSLTEETKIKQVGSHHLLANARQKLASYS